MARAQQSSSYPFNQIGRREVQGILGTIRDIGFRQAVRAEMDRALAGNTFALDVGRADILRRAARFGRVAWTRRDPDNKRRLWLMIGDRFAVVFDEETGLFEDQSTGVADLGLARANVSGLAFTGGHVVALAEGRLASFDRVSQEWRAAPVPEAVGDLAPASLAGNGSHTVRVGFDGPGAARAATWCLYEPVRDVWTVEDSDVRYLQDLGQDAGARAFALLRHGEGHALTGFQAACALDQWRDLVRYCRQNAPGIKAADLLGPEGVPARGKLVEIAASHGVPAAAVRPYFKGVTLPAWWREGLIMPESLDALRQIRAAGAGWVAITPTGYQNDPLSVEIGPDPEKTASLESIETAVKAAHELGLEVLLKPHLNLLIEEKDDHMWRGMIRPRTDEEVAVWFRNYGAFLMPYVDLAIRNGVEMMTVGVELRRMTEFDTRWRELIATVRRRGYRGRLTYAALHEDYARVPFWSALDFVGIDAYFRATKSNRAGLGQITVGMMDLAERLGRFSAQVGKPIVFTEVGFNNLDGCNVRPWFWSGNRAATDNLEQAACYHAALDVFPRCEWFAGMFWWSWSPSGPPLPSDPSYSPQFKLAELILESYYRPAGGTR